jgi:hypothetical protein
LHEPSHGVLVQRQIRLAGEEYRNPTTVVLEQLAGLAALHQMRLKAYGQALEART